MASKKTQETLAKGAKARKVTSPADVIAQAGEGSSSTMDSSGVPAAAVEPKPTELDVLRAIHGALGAVAARLDDVAKAIREAGLAVAVTPPKAPRVPSTVSSLPPTPPPGEPAHAAGQTRHTPAEQGEHPTPPEASGGKVAVPAPAPTTATLQQAQQAVLKHSAANGSAKTAAILKGLGVERVSAYTGADAPQVYAAIVKALS